MTAHYLDPSAWVKRYFSESGSDVVTSVFGITELACCSTIGVIEILATIARKGRFERIDSDVLNAISAQAKADFQAFEQIEPTETILQSAAGLAFDLGLRAGDAIHLASALAMAAHDDTDLVMVSADTELLAAAQAKGLRTLNPEQAS
jgi:predicted nucleic acid-binding protein